MHQHSARSKDICDLFLWDFFIFVFKECLCWYVEFSSEIPVTDSNSQNILQALWAGAAWGMP